MAVLRSSSVFRSSGTGFGAFFLIFFVFVYGSQVWRDKLDRDGVKLKLQREGRYVGTVTMVERQRNSNPGLAPAAKPVGAVIGFDLHSNSSELGYYSGVGKLKLVGHPEVWPIEVSSLYVHQHADDGSFAATLRIRSPDSAYPVESSLTGLPPSFDIHGKLQPPGLILEGDKEELTDGALHKGDLADFDRLAQSLGGAPAGLPR